MSSSSWFPSPPLKGYWETGDRLTGLGLDMESKTAGMISEETVIYKKSLDPLDETVTRFGESETGKGVGQM